MGFLTNSYFESFRKILRETTLAECLFKNISGLSPATSWKTRKPTKTFELFLNYIKPMILLSGSNNSFSLFIMNIDVRRN